MSDEYPTGGFTVELDGQDIQHLTKTGTSIVTKDVGPITVKIRCPARVYPRFVMEEDGETTEVFE